MQMLLPSQRWTEHLSAAVSHCTPSWFYRVSGRRFMDNGG